MKIATTRFAVSAIAARIGIAVKARLRKEDGEELCEFIPEDGHPNETFSVLLVLGWRSAEVRFVPGKFSGQLISRMGMADQESKDAFMAFAAALTSRRTKVTMRINDSHVQPMDCATWPAQWLNADFAVTQSPFHLDSDDDAICERIVLDLVLPVFGMVASLVGTEENDLVSTGEVEGRAVQSISTRYERKRLNREACIQLKGESCSVCGFNFGNIYGDLGMGYIEVHHVKPISSLGENYRISIIDDLVPLCANCHAMVHREDPPVEVDALKNLMKERTKKAF